MKTIRVELDLTPAMIDQLRWVIDGLPICTYAPLIMAVLPKLPLENEFTQSASDLTPAAGARPAQSVAEPGRGFTLRALTPKGEAGLTHLERVMARLPHTGDEL